MMKKAVLIDNMESAFPPGYCAPTAIEPDVKSDESAETTIEPAAPVDRTIASQATRFTDQEEEEGAGCLAKKIAPALSSALLTGGHSGRVAGRDLVRED